MVKVNWAKGFEAARTFRDSNQPGIVFRYKAAFTTEREAVDLIKKLKDQGIPYRKQQRPNYEGGRDVHVVFEGVPKGQAKRSHAKRGLNQFGVYVTNNPDQTRIPHDGKVYAIYDAYPNLQMAKEVAEDYRSQPYPLDSRRYRCRAIVADLGRDAGRLRWAIFIAKGVRWT